jgi:hypothetical protein
MYLQMFTVQRYHSPQSNIPDDQLYKLKKVYFCYYEITSGYR